MRNKKLTEDDLKLWSRVANTIEKQMKDKVELKNKNFLRPKTTISNKVPTKNSDYKYENILTGNNSIKEKKKNSNIDKKILSKLKAGKLRPEEILDLHGYTLIRAKKAVSLFVCRAYGEKKRLLLIITGKGKADSSWDLSLVKKGVLKKEVPIWLKEGPLGEKILNVSVANVRHGGSGALYVYLKRNKALR
tara:strand:- start:1010 stop:1582 length:573 start_codon:yes stop_codon:yes gene_type:complete